MAARQCGDCQLCCKLLPMQELDKPAGVRCQHQRVHKGCMIYRRKPPQCSAWSCSWLLDNDTHDQQRPDRSHYVLDCIPDYVRVRNNETGEIVGECPVVQIWLDPGFPEARHHPALRAYILRRAHDGFGAILRWDNRRAIVVFAPPLAADGQWHEIETGTEVEQQHTMLDVLRVMRGEPPR